MKANFTALALVLVVFLQAQTPGKNSSVLMSATVNQSLNQINVEWDDVEDADDFNIYRKVKGSATWSLLQTGLSPSTLNYVDDNVSKNISYEYKVKCNRLSNTEEAFGYINAGGELPIIESRGRVLLVVDNTFETSLATELLQLQNDLKADGWKVNVIYVGRTETPQNVKQKIQNVYLSNMDLSALYLIGHVPVPYSGAIAPDGHLDHVGAWPTDAFYGDINYTWKDTRTNTIQAVNTRNHNIPFDGKFDHSYLPTNVELQVGRVDMSNLPAFAESEEDLLRTYLEKAHLFKTGQIVADEKAVVDDNFTGHNFSNSAWKSYAALVGKDNVVAQDYLTCLENKSHLFSYGSGGGSYSSAVGVVSTADFASSFPKGIFTMLLGSYFGEWDTQDNLLRAAIASGDILTSTWVGLPNYYFHHMSMGENIGYSIKLSQNNTNSQYEPVGFYPRMVHMNLMGDPTLRMHYFDGAKNTRIVVDNGDVNLEWEASSDPAVIGYHVYKSIDNGDYFRMTTNPLSSTSFIDPCLEDNGTYGYMVRALKKQDTNTGSYFNLSTGDIANITIDGSNSCLTNLPVELIDFSARKTGDVATLFWKTANESNFGHFELERSADAHLFEMIARIDGKGKAATVSNYIFEDKTALSGINYYRLKILDLDGTYKYSEVQEVYFERNDIAIFPNPSTGKLYVELPNINLEGINLEILDMKGSRVFYQKEINNLGNNKLGLSLAHLSSGTYMLKLNASNQIYTKTFILKTQ